MRIALAQINPTVGDIDANARLIEDAIARARELGADLVVLPELSLCGYPPKDLLLQGGFLDACAEASRRIGENATKDIAAVFGVPFTQRSGNAGGVHNSLVVYANNAHVADYHKRLLPTYDVFDEDRYFTPGDEAVVVSIVAKSGRTWRVGLSICEDLWKGDDVGFGHRYAGRADPVEALIAAGAEVIVNPSASPFVLGKGLKHRRIVQGHATRHKVPVLAVNQVGGNDELVFDGHAVAYGGDGALLATGPGFVEGVTIVDLEAASDAQDAAHAAGHAAGGDHIRDALLTTAPEELAFRALTLGVRDYLRKTGFKSAVIGLSGGIDSALTAAVAVAAIGAANVLGVAMPGPYSSSHSVQDAQDLARRLGVKIITLGISNAFATFRTTLDGSFADIGASAMGKTLPDIAEENLQSRLRGTALMAISNRTGAIVLTTGNKSELAVGYCTLYGDMNGGLAVLADADKELVYALSRWVNVNHAKVGLSQAPIPQRTIDKAPSAELRPNQTDQDSLPPYDVLDRILDLYVEAHASVGQIVRETGYALALVQRVTRLVDVSEFKRKQAAIGIKLTSVAFGSGRRMPIAQRWRSP